MLGVIILSLSSVSWVAEGSAVKVYPTPDVDITTGLFGRTIFLEYSVPNFIGYWIGHDEMYNGTLFSTRPDHLFDPEEKTRLQVEDCGDGYACFRSRWQEDDSQARWYLSDQGDRATFREVSDAVEDDYTKWRVYCTHEDKFTFCYVCDHYFSWLYDTDNCLYAKEDFSLNTDFASDFEFPDNIFLFSIYVPKAKAGGYTLVGETSCNTEADVITEDLSYTAGVSNTVSAPWTFTESISAEIRWSVEHDLEGTEWEQELPFPETFQEEATRTLHVPIPPGHKVMLVQLTASYGPYRIKGSNSIKTTAVPC